MTGASSLKIVLLLLLLLSLLLLLLLVVNNEEKAKRLFNQPSSVHPVIFDDNLISVKMKKNNI